MLHEIRRERDLVFLDQRGTGSSHRLSCRLATWYGDVQDYFTELFPVDRVRACRADLERVADLTRYTTPIAMDDLDEVREALGYDTINLYGISYGTLAALQYLRQRPGRVRAMLLAGVSTPATFLPLQFARGSQDVMDALVRDCAADDACRAAFPALKADFTAVLAAFEAGPARFELPHPVTRLLEPVSLSRGVFVERLRLMLYDLESASRVPILIHRAAHGDWAPFGEAALGWGGSPFGIAFGAYLTITCSESVAVITEADIVRETRDTFLGEYRTRVHVRACREWPRGRIPAGYYAPVRSNVPVLMLSGELDSATPLHFGRSAARSLPNSRQVVMRNAPHIYWSDCLGNLAAEFIARASARDLDASCVDGVRRPPFVTAWPPPGR